MFVYKVIVFDNNLNHNIILFNEDLDGAIRYTNEHNRKTGPHKMAFPVKCLENKINLIAFYKEGSFIDYIRTEPFDKDEVDVVNHIASQTCLPLTHIIA